MWRKHYLSKLIKQSFHFQEISRLKIFAKYLLTVNLQAESVAFDMFLDGAIASASQNFGRNDAL